MKGSREMRKSLNIRKSRTKKRKNVFNPKTAETDESSFSASAKKFKEQEEISVPRARESTRDGRMARRQHQLELLEAAESAEGVLYGPGIDNSM